MTQPLISVIVPVRERRQFLSQCLGSIFEQIRGLALENELEIIVQDNASPSPGMKDVVFEASQGLALYERNERDLGCYGSVNRAIRRSRGMWIHVLHDDDWVLPDFYDQVVKAFSRFVPAAGSVFTHYKNVNTAPEQIQGDLEWSPLSFDGGSLDSTPPREPVLVDMLGKMVTGNPLQTCAVVFRRELYDQLGGFREDLPYTGDWEFWVRLALLGPWAYVPRTLAVYCWHATNETHAMTAIGETARSIRRTLETFSMILPPYMKPLLVEARRFQAQQLTGAAYNAFQAKEPGLAKIFLQEAGRILEP